jgi:hypothetical protein
MTHTFKKSALTVALLSLLVGCNDDGTNGINGTNGIASRRYKWYSTANGDGIMVTVQME